MFIHTNENHSNIMFQTNPHINIQLNQKTKHVTILIGLMITFCYPCLRTTKKNRNHMYSKKDYFEHIISLTHDANEIHFEKKIDIKPKNHKTIFQLHL
jgi:hypothetical protein